MKSLEKKVYCLYALCPRSLKFLQETIISCFLYTNHTHSTWGGKCSNLILENPNFNADGLYECVLCFTCPYDDQE